MWDTGWEMGSFLYLQGAPLPEAAKESLGGGAVSRRVSAEGRGEEGLPAGKA